MDTDDLLRADARRRDSVLRAPAVIHALEELGDHIECVPQADLRPRRSRRAGAAAAVLVTVCIGVAVPTGAAASAIEWASARTGLFGRPGDIENDTSEFLDASAPEMRAVIERHTSRYTLPVGASWDPAYKAVMTDERVLVQERVVAAIVARTAVCAWEREWLRAHAASDHERAQQAAGLVASASTWADVVAEDPTGGLRRHLDGVARAALAGDDRTVRSDVAVNCAVAR